jgi:N-hydroxyarylamine O-acetyltransferase
MIDGPVWDAGALDLDAYLGRIGDDGPRDPGVATLTRLHRAHVAAVPFENLDIMLGRGIAVDLPSVQAKLVGRRRGGYCFEHATLFGAVLQRLGFRVDRLLARTGDPLEHPRPRSHMVLRVATGDGPWLADVGFGSGLLTPLPLAEGGPHRQGAWAYELVRGPDTAWRLREHDGAGWTAIQTFTEEPQYQVDVEVANHHTATSSGSPFVRQPIVVRKDETSVRRLIGREYTVDRPGEPVVRRRCADGEYAGVLRDLGLDLPTGEVEALVATLPPDDGEAER